MNRLIPLCMLVSVSACDTFRALDSVTEPEPWDTSTLGPDSGDAGAAGDAGNNPTDMGGQGDAGSSDADMAEPADIGGEVGIDVGPPAGCLRNFAFAPAWAMGTVSVPKAEVVDTDVYPGVSLAGHDNDGSESGRFGFALRYDEAGTPRARFYTFAGDASGSIQNLTIPHSVLEPWRDVAVAASTAPNEFAFVALGENPTCVDVGPLVYSGTLAAGGVPTIEETQSEEGNCGQYRPRVALTGPLGSSPNLSVVRDASTAIAFPGGDTSPIVDSMSPRISASTKDVVAVPASLGRWHAWKPGNSGDGTAIVDLDTFGTLQVEWLYDDCYIAASPRQQLVRIASLECTGACDVTEQDGIDPGEFVSAVDVARMPGGGYVVVIAHGQALQRLVAYFFDDAGQVVMLNGADSVELANVGKVVTDFAIAAIPDGDRVVIAAVYTTSPFVAPALADDARVATLVIDGVEF